MSHAVTIFLILSISMGLADVAVSAEPTTEPVDLVHPCSSVAELHHKGFSPLP